MTRIRSILNLTAISLAFWGCVSLSYPEYETSTATQQTDLIDDSPVLEGSPEFPLETALTWSDLTRMARDEQRLGNFDESERLLEQASILVADQAPTDARRRAVFGARARFAEQLGHRGENARADALADMLIAEAEAEPALGGSALISLALSVVDRRVAAQHEAQVESGTESEIDPQLPILHVALLAAQAGTVNRDRLELAYRVSREAYFEGDLALARDAIDQAIADALILAQSNRVQIGRLSLQRARIATDQGDFAQAIADAALVNQIAEQLDADAASRGQGEALLAEALALSGESDRALAIARAARARLDGEEAIEDHSQRVILTALARIESAIGHPERATRYYDEALALPGQDSRDDRDLVSKILLERAAVAAMRSTPDASPAGPTPE